MVFPSYIFIFIFFPIVMTIWLNLKSASMKLFFLTFSSYVFYGWWDYRFLSLLIISTLIDFYCGGKIYNSNKSANRKTFLFISIFSNLIILGFFKYFNFFSSSTNELFLLIGISYTPIFADIILPLGISFYTLQSMSYSLDIYFKRAKPATNLIEFSAYVSLFPQLVAGPIVRYGHIDEQLKSLKRKLFETKEFSLGLWFFTIGLAKKILIADRLAPLADGLFLGSGPVPFGEAWAGSLAYTAQIYFDFSGYSDMAVGLGLMLGFRLPINFLSPYKSKSISEFWGRWHITLSHYLRDYLYIPLDGNRGGTLRTLRNLMVVMFIGGLWHGAQITFVLWGIYHGLLLILYNLFSRVTKFHLPKICATLITFFSVLFGWVVFRADSLERVKEIWSGLLGLSGIEISLLNWVDSQTFGEIPQIIDVFGRPFIFAILMVSYIIIFCFNNTFLYKPRLSLIWGVISGILLFLSVTFLGEETPFLYFQF